MLFKKRIECPLQFLDPGKQEIIVFVEGEMKSQVFLQTT